MIPVERKGYVCGGILVVVIFVLAAANLLLGSVDIPAGAVWGALTGGTVENEAWSFIVWESRVPLCVTAWCCGAALAASGLMLQTVFNNPLADPSILGISSGASLGVALVMLAGGGMVSAGTFSFSGFLAVVAGAFAGAVLVMGVILFLSTLIRSSVMLLIAGIMMGYVGNFGGVSLEQLPWFAAFTSLGLLMSILLIKPLNALLLGERYAENLGVSVRRTRSMLLVVTGILTAVVTAFCGPVSFIGLAVPHVARLLLGTSNHNSLLPVTLLSGGAVALLCNLICILPGEAGLLPLNAVTPVLGAPVIIYVIVNQRRIQYFN